MKVKVEHVQAVWETTSFDADIPEDVDPQEFVEDNIVELMQSAIDDGRATIEQGTEVSDVDSEINVQTYDNDGFLHKITGDEL